MRRTTRYFLGLAGASALALVLIGHALATRTTAANGPVPLPQSIPPAVAGATSGAPLAASTPLTITVALRTTDAAALARFTAAVATPGNPLFRHFLTPAAFAAAFAPPPTAVGAVRTWLTSSGWRITQERSGGLFISATGTAAQAQATFGVHLWQFLGKDGAPFYSNADAVLVPAALAPSILAVAGLDSAPRAHPQYVFPKDHHAPQRDNAASCPTASSSSFIPAQLAKAYEFPTVAAAHPARLAMVELDGYIPGDISAFARCFMPGVNTATLVQPRLVDTKTALPAGDGAVEVELDIEIALGLVPGLTGMDVYEAPNTGAGWLDVFAAIANDNRDGTVSVSWGSCEGNLAGGQAEAENVVFQQMVAQGQGVYVAAGDTGAYDCLPNDGSGQGDQSLNADDPSANPNVIAVGGTALHTTAGGAYGDETVWNNSTEGTFAAGGGGTSVVWKSPTWQAQSLATPGTTVGRALPDVTADADPNTGYTVYCTEANGCGGAGWITVGGTSAAAPLWAALATLANGTLGSRVGLITPAVYGLYGADANGQGGIARGGITYVDYTQGVSGATVGTPALHDITGGNNSFPGFAPGYAAAMGFDRASGLGSMHGQALVGYLTNLGTGTPPTPTPALTPTPANGAGGQLTLLGRGTNGRYWLTRVSPGATPSGSWAQIDPLTFTGAPAATDDGAGGMWIAGIGSDGALHYGRYALASGSFGGWASLTGATCLGAPALAFTQATLFVTCRTTGNGIAINALNVAANHWGGWAWIGGGLASSPTMTTDGATLLILAQAPQYRGDQSDWYTFYTVGTGATSQWRNFRTTCADTPGVAWVGQSAQFALTCVAADTHTAWLNTLTATAASSSLSGWTNAGAPSPGLQLGAGILVDRIDSAGYTFVTGLGRDNAAYLWQRAGGAGGPWVRLSLPGIFTGSFAADYSAQ